MHNSILHLFLFQAHFVLTLYLMGGKCIENIFAKHEMFPQTKNDDNLNSRYLQGRKLQNGWQNQKKAHLCESKIYPSFTFSLFIDIISASPLMLDFICVLFYF